MDGDIKMSKEHIDSRKTYAVQRSTLEAIGIELVIAQQEYEKQLIDKYPVEPDQVFYKEQIEYLEGLISHLHKVTNNELLLISKP
jgi:soluble cytochrome b562